MNGLDNRIVDEGVQQRVDRIDFRVEQLFEHCLDYINAWEETFITDIYNNYWMTDKLDRLTTKQVNIIFRMWKDMHEKGRVKLPEGKI